MANDSQNRRSLDDTSGAGSLRRRSDSGIRRIEPLAMATPGVHVSEQTAAILRDLALEAIARGLSKSQIARGVGCSPQNLANFLGGATLMVGSAIMLCHTLECDPWEYPEFRPFISRTGDVFPLLETLLEYGDRSKWSEAAIYLCRGGFAGGEPTRADTAPGMSPMRIWEIRLELITKALEKTLANLP